MHITSFHLRGHENAFKRNLSSGTCTLPPSMGIYFKDDSPPLLILCSYSYSTLGTSPTGHAYYTLLLCAPTIICFTTGTSPISHAQYTLYYWCAPTIGFHWISSTRSPLHMPVIFVSFGCHLGWTLVFTQWPIILLVSLLFLCVSLRHLIA